MRNFLTLTAAAALAVAFGFGGVANAQVTFPFDGDLVGYWSFDDGADPTADNSGNGNTGALKPDSSEPLFDTGELAPIFGNVNSLEYDGANDFVEVLNESNFDFANTDSFTLAAWIKLSDAEQSSSDRFVMAKQQSSGTFSGYYFLVRSTDDKIRAVLESAGVFIIVDGSTDVADDSFHHVAMVWDGSCVSPPPDASCLEIYVDGVAEGTTSTDNLGTATILNNVPLTIGSRDGGQIPFVGNIDDARVYNRALTAEEILALFTGIAVGKELVSATDGGDGVLALKEEWEFVMKVTVANNTLNDLTNAAVRDPLPGDLELGDGTSGDLNDTACDENDGGLFGGDTVVQSVGSITMITRGNSDKCIIDWTIPDGNLDAGEFVTLTITTSTDVNPAGIRKNQLVKFQEYTSGTTHCINQGAELSGTLATVGSIVVQSNGLEVSIGDTLPDDVAFVTHDDCD